MITSLHYIFRFSLAQGKFTDKETNFSCLTVCSPLSTKKQTFTNAIFCTDVGKVQQFPSIDEIQVNIREILLQHQNIVKVYVQNSQSTFR